MTEKFKNLVFQNADCTDMVDYLIENKAITDNGMRNYIIRQEFNDQWKNTKKSQNTIIADIAADYDLSFSSVYFIVK